MAGNTPLNRAADVPLDVDAMLRREMAVEPSPEFLPRVRERIRDESPQTRWQWRWLLPAGALVAACVAVLAVNLPPAAPIAAPPAPSLATAKPIAPIALSPVDPVFTLEREPRNQHVRVAAASAAGEPALPTVIVDQRQRLALATLVRIIRAGKLTDESFAQTTPVNLEAIREQVKPVQIGPVTVSPIAVDGVLPSEKQ
jgi:hypothetical protein